MARKTSDIAMLLGSRSKSRSRSTGGFGSQLVGFVDQLLGRKKKNSRSRMSSRGPLPSVSAWIFGGGLLLAFGAGFLLGGRLGGTGDGNDPLRAQPRQPTVLHDIDGRAETPHGYVVAVFPQEDEREAAARAAALGDELNDLGLAGAKEFLFPTKDGGRAWTTVVFYQGDAERDQAKLLLQQVASQVRDPWFVDFKNQYSASWPVDYDIPTQ